ncbi:hypothetical protein H113_02104 [Trichophyton rubrum MR1459]|uniref:Uncharacterized protein n=1 Tax=Trichophyton rubrum (strain ATCC MYA-4607 / CBS 118892) TaxID=559305 RepID=A0A080WLC2_TRIRC|nr:uncharacterized protein TERG_12466 [Trichophyton rubrum CBS 118892]EZF98128.1 hypothetical protein H113_02104 [Trichophyton rubrum MR1459]EZG08921.1 hypothetical protein H106_01963 [Trichophyton rubrum CBS 735.88]KFL62494.1 hypothetical protein TERG_12466 [Trichophyton rubrum CBS 118892]
MTYLRIQRLAISLATPSPSLDASTMSRQPHTSRSKTFRHFLPYQLSSSLSFVRTYDKNSAHSCWRTTASSLNECVLATLRPWATQLSRAFKQSGPSLPFTTRIKSSAMTSVVPSQMLRTQVSRNILAIFRIGSSFSR